MPFQCLHLLLEAQEACGRSARALVIEQRAVSTTTMGPQCWRWYTSDSLQTHSTVRSFLHSHEKLAYKCARYPQTIAAAQA